MRELELIARIDAALGSAGADLRGDDAAVVAAHGAAVTSIDAIAEEVHFQLATHAPADVGWKALATALSDLAATGAEPGEAYVALALPEPLWDERAVQIAAGLADCARATGTVVAGGDATRAPALVVTVAVVGWTADAGSAVRRSGAEPGDRIGVTGALGGSGAGLALLGGLDVPNLPDDQNGVLLERHRRPRAQLAAGRALARAGVSAMIDLSDGVATDAGHIAASSRVAVKIELDRLPLDDGVAEVAAAAARDPAELAVTAGDDYELLFTATGARVEAIEQAAAGAGVPVTWIGATSEGSGLTLLDAEGDEVDLSGHEH